MLRSIYKILIDYTKRYFKTYILLLFKPKRAAKNNYRSVRIIGISPIYFFGINYFLFGAISELFVTHTFVDIQLTRSFAQGLLNKSYGPINLKYALTDLCAIFIISALAYIIYNFRHKKFKYGLFVVAALYSFAIIQPFDTAFRTYLLNINLPNKEADIQLISSGKNTHDSIRTINSPLGSNTDYGLGARTENKEYIVHLHPKIVAFSWILFIPKLSTLVSTLSLSFLYPKINLYIERISGRSTTYIFAGTTMHPTLPLKGIYSISFEYFNFFDIETAKNAIVVVDTIDCKSNLTKSIGFNRLEPYSYRGVYYKHPSIAFCGDWKYSILWPIEKNFSFARLIATEGSHVVIYNNGSINVDGAPISKICRTGELQVDGYDESSWTNVSRNTYIVDNPHSKYINDRQFYQWDCKNCFGIMYEFQIPPGKIFVMFDNPVPVSRFYVLNKSKIVGMPFFEVKHRWK